MSDTENKDVPSEPESEEKPSDLPEPETNVSTEEKVSPKKSPKKTPKKKKPESEDEDDDSDEEPQLGLLERPVVIESGKRERKKVEKLEMKVTTPTNKKLEIQEGAGMKLGECERIEYNVNKHKAEDLKQLHRILFGVKGASSGVKKNIRQFSGFTFKTDSPEYEKKVAILSKCFLSNLKGMCEILDLERSGTKDAIVSRLMDFLMKPQSSGKALPKPKKRRSSTKKPEKGKRKRKTKKNNEKPEKKKTPKKAAKPKVEEEEVDDVSDSDEEEEEEEKSESEVSSEEEEEQPKKKKAKVEKAPTPKKSPKKSPKKPVKKPEKKAPTPKKRKATEDDSSSDDEPLLKKPKPPGDDELRDIIKKILDGANLEEVTMKTVCKQVYARYPDFDLTDRKDFIKSTVRQIIS